MRVDDIRAIPVRVPLSPTIEGAGDGGAVERTLVHVTTDSGVEGWGEMHTEPSPTVVTAVVDDVVAPRLVDRPVREIGPLREEFFYYYLDVDVFLGGVETALWDARARAAGVPLHHLLGGTVREEVPFSFFGGDLPPAESPAVARAARDRGFDVVKAKGSEDWRRDVERIERMHEAVDGELDFRLDPNQAWGFEDAVRVGAELSDAGIRLQYLEQPIRVDAFGTYERLRERLQQPICVNEDSYRTGNLFELVSRDAVDAAVVDLAASGGISAVSRLTDLAGQAGLSLAHHSGGDLGVQTAAVLHLVATTPAIDLPSDTVYDRLKDDVLETAFTLADGRLSVPDGPGLGVDVDRSKVELYRLDT
jgi:L-alanine-DL-glutamate epimerase-like enolase superfamily enzyme